MKNLINKKSKRIKLISYIFSTLFVFGLFFGVSHQAFAVTYTVNATKVGNGTITPSGNVSVNFGDSPLFILTPTSGNHITSVTVNGANIGTPASFFITFVTSNMNVVANFAPDAASNSITATAGAGGTISPAGATSVNFGANQVYTISPSAGNQIQDISVDGNNIGATSTYTFVNVTMPHTISATFAANTYTISSSAGAGGTISPLGSTVVNMGAAQSYTITPTVGNHIIDVVVDGVSKGVVSSYNFNSVSANHTISVVFTSNSFSIFSSSDINGTISPLGTTTVSANTNQTYTITPNPGYSVSNVLVDGLSVGSSTTYAFSNVLANHTISVINVLSSSVPHSITLNPGWNLMTLPLQAVDLVTGQPINYTAESFGAIASATVITEWLAPTQQYQSHIIGFPLNDFPLTNGMGFFINSPATSTFSITGNPFVPATTTLSIGWNLIGWNNAATTTADTFAISLGGVDVLSKFDNSTQMYQSHIVNFPLNNFIINPGDGIFIHKI